MSTSSKRLCILLLSFLPVSAFSELQLLDEDGLSNVVGRAGLTIDIETEVTIAEFEYVDAGSMYIKDISFTGIGGGLVDDLRATVDVSSGAETLMVGFADYAMLGDAGFLDATDADVAWAIAEFSDGFGGYGKTHGDGDLVIHVSSVDYGIDFTQPPIPANYAANLLAIQNEVDFNFTEGEFGIRSSDGAVETTLSSNFSIDVYLGYLDILITNRGNGFSDTTTAGQPQGIKLMDSYISIDAKFRVEDLDIDNTNNARNTFIDRSVTNTHLTLRDMRIHNERGDDTLGSFGFASVQSKIAAATGILSSYDNPGALARNTDGQAIYDINVNWDWDIPHISFGDSNVSIGEVYLTDYVIKNTSLVISAHE